ncbi:alpha/beta hydrolase [Jannaschia sp. CCS1]|nr:alpha/beta hydrolase [Jannaschia sp. CCS1]
MLHCTLAKGAAWAGVARHLRDQLSMVAPDLLSHGEGPHHDPARDFHDQATEAATMHLPEGRSHLIGHSFGATIALRLALDHPTRVKTLTLIEPVLFCAATGPGRAAHDAHIAGVPRALAAGDTAQAARIFLGLWGAEPYDTMSPALQRYVTDRIWIPDACAPALDHDRAQILPRLMQLPAPTLLVQGAASPPVIAEIMARLSHLIPVARGETIPGAAHMSPVTHARQTASAIAGFIAQA